MGALDWLFVIGGEQAGALIPSNPIARLFGVLPLFEHVVRAVVVLAFVVWMMWNEGEGTLRLLLFVAGATVAGAGVLWLSLGGW